MITIGLASVDNLPCTVQQRMRTEVLKPRLDGTNVHIIIVIVHNQVHLSKYLVQCRWHTTVFLRDILDAAELNHVLYNAH